MPTYEYECETCGIRFERWQRMTDEPLKKCPECDGAVHRLLFPVGIVFKGSGFYCTDNRSGSAMAAPGEKHEEHKPETPKAEDTKTEKADKAKPEAKPEKKEAGK